MVFTYEKCLCGGTMLPTEESCSTDYGVGHIYKCTKCGKTEKTTEAVNL